MLGTASKNLLGPNYNYAQQIKSPLDLGMAGTGSLDQLADDVSYLLEYIQVLVSGPSDALKIPSRPLGNKFFLKTVGKCEDTSTGELEDRYIYINNVPTGNIPFLSAISGTDLSEFRGLAPGVLTNLNVLNPITLIESMFAGGTPSCHEVTWPTIDNSGVETYETQYIVDADVKNMDPCDVSTTYCKPSWGYDSDNILGSPRCCAMGFQNRLSPADANPGKDEFSEIYFMILGLLALFILLKLMHKTRK